MIFKSNCIACKNFVKSSTYIHTYAITTSRKIRQNNFSRSPPIIAFSREIHQIFRFHGKIRQNKTHIFISYLAFSRKNWANQQTKDTSLFCYFFCIFNPNISDTNSWKFDWIDILLLCTYPLFCLCATFSMHISTRKKKGLEGLRKVSFLTIRVHTCMLCTHLYLCQNSKQKVAHFLFVKTKFPKYIFFCLTGETIYQKYSYVT